MGWRSVTALACKSASGTGEIHRPPEAVLHVNGFAESVGRGREVTPRIGCRDDLAHTRLVESLKAIVALEVFQVRSDRPLPAELVRLLCADQSRCKQPADSLLGHRPPLTLGKSLLQVIKTA